MNIQALNAGSTIGRPRVPRNNVSFGKAPKAKAAKSTAENTAKSAENIFKKAGKGIQKAFTTAKDFVVSIPSKVKGIKTAKTAKTAETAAKKGFKTTVAEKFSSLKKGTKTTFEKAHKRASAFIAKNKGTKLAGIAAMALTVLIAGTLAIKEIHDIITKSNPEN